MGFQVQLNSTNSSRIYDNNRTNPLTYTALGLDEKSSLDVFDSNKSLKPSESTTVCPKCKSPIIQSTEPDDASGMPARARCERCDNNDNVSLPRTPQKKNQSNLKIFICRKEEPGNPSIHGPKMLPQAARGRSPRYSSLIRCCTASDFPR